MRNPVQLDQHHNEAIRTEIADRLRYLLSSEVSSIAEMDQIQEQAVNLMRLQSMEQETTDLLAARLLQDIISQMVADLKEQVGTLVAEQRYEHH
jgi:hypothetical protein